jgi:ankyrin repeat protein
VVSILTIFFILFLCIKFALTEKGRGMERLSGRGYILIYLFSAVCAGRLDMVTLLLEHNANPNICDDSGLTATHYAINNDLKDIFLVREMGVREEGGNNSNNNNK